jgi:hypothetical protein
VPSENGHHDWFVVVKIKDTEDMGQTALEHYAQDVADSIYPEDGFESAHVVMDDGFGRYIRPRWATDHEVQN